MMVKLENNFSGMEWQFRSSCERSELELLNWGVEIIF